MTKRFATIALPLAAALSLGACAEAEEEKTYETDVVDESGGELIVSDADTEGVPVDTPDTPMTNVPPEDAATDTEAEPAE